MERIEYGILEVGRREKLLDGIIGIEICRGKR
jgi:hypothetical protein